MAALAGRPAPPEQVHRSAVPGIVLLVVAFVLFWIAGGAPVAAEVMPELVLGFVALIAAVILLCPFCLSLLARLGRRAPIAVRLALRDLARYRARSGSALAAISLGVLIAVIISVLSAGTLRQRPRLRRAQPGVEPARSSPPPNGPAGGGDPGAPAGTATPADPAALEANVHDIAASVGSRDVVELDTTSSLAHPCRPGRNWDGPIYVATPQLLRAFGITSSAIDPAADILTMRPGLSDAVRHAAHLRRQGDLRRTRYRADPRARATSPAPGARAWPTR